MAERLFHVSGTFLGEHVTLKPRAPVGAALGEDRRVKRVSLAGSIDECLTGITKSKLSAVMYAYKFAGNTYDAELDWNLPRQLVPDWGTDGLGEMFEVWALGPCPLKFIYPIQTRYTAYDDDPPSHVRIRKNYWQITGPRTVRFSKHFGRIVPQSEIDFKSSPRRSQR
jgi:hypothetical protein